MSLTTAQDPVNEALRPSVLASLTAFERKLDEMVSIRQRIGHDLLAELWRRAEQSSEADGYPSTSMGSGIHGGDVNSSTETAALAGYPSPDDDRADPPTRPQTPDEVIGALSEAYAEVSEAHGLMRRVDRRLVFAKARGESHRGRVAEGGDCLACTEFVSGAPGDRLRAGFCGACARAWARFRQGRSEDQGTLRRQFIVQRRVERDAERAG